MEIQDVKSNCPNCGAPIELEGDSQALVCKYCSSVIALISETNGQQELVEEPLPVLRKVEPELTYKANHWVTPDNSQGGSLWITEKEVVFKPHSFNMGPLGKRYIRIQDIVGYQKGMLTNMSIFTEDGYEMALVVWKKDEIINAIESRRINYFKSKGMSVPPLQIADGVHVSDNITEDDAVPASQLNGRSGCMGVVVTCIISLGALIYGMFSFL